MAKLSSGHRVGHNSKGTVEGEYGEHSLTEHQSIDFLCAVPPRKLTLGKIQLSLGQ